MAELPGLRLLLEILVKLRRAAELRQQPRAACQLSLVLVKDLRRIPAPQVGKRVVEQDEVASARATCSRPANGSSSGVFAGRKGTVWQCPSNSLRSVRNALSRMKVEVMDFSCIENLTPNDDDLMKAARLFDRSHSSCQRPARPLHHRPMQYPAQIQAVIEVMDHIQDHLERRPAGAGRCAARRLFPGAALYRRQGPGRRRRAGLFHPAPRRHARMAHRAGGAHGQCAAGGHHRAAARQGG